MKLRDLHAFDDKIDTLEQEIEGLLLQTDGRLFLTVPGMGVSTSAELYAEIGNISHFTNAGQLIKKAGTNPIVKQTGGSVVPTAKFQSKEMTICAMLSTSR